MCVCVCMCMFACMHIDIGLIARKAMRMLKPKKRSPFRVNPNLKYINPMCAYEYIHICIYVYIFRSHRKEGDVHAQAKKKKTT